MGYGKFAILVNQVDKAVQSLLKAIITDQASWGAGLVDLFLLVTAASQRPQCESSVFHSLYIC